MISPIAHSLIKFDFTVKGSGTVLLDTKTPSGVAWTEIRNALVGGIDHSRCNISGHFVANISHLDLTIPNWKQEAAP
jgi:hypothetical protein